MDSNLYKDQTDAKGDTGTEPGSSQQHEHERMKEEVSACEDHCGGIYTDALHDSDMSKDDSKSNQERDSKGREEMETGEISTDARFLSIFNTTIGNTSQVPTLPVVSQETDVYDMNNKYRGHALVVNNERFSVKLNQQGLGNRTGSSVDEKNIQKCLHDLGFRVTVYPDLTAGQMRSVCSQMAAKNHSECDCFVCVILSHGEEGIVYGVDQIIEIKELTKYFKGDMCPTLVGKPKIFFIQACRGYQTDPGVLINVADAKGQAFDDTDAFDRQVIKLPVEADFLFAYSTVPGYYSWRNGMNGSWFIQALCEILVEHGKKMEIRKLLTLVNKRVSQNFESLNPDNKDFHKMKQIPCITSMLTKDVIFNTPKRKRIF